MELARQAAESAEAAARSTDAPSGRELITTTELTGVPEAHRRGATGKGVTVGIIDSGIAYDHPALGGGGFPNAQVLGGYDFADGDPDPYDELNTAAAGHGTHVAGIVAGRDTHRRFGVFVDLDDGPSHPVLPGVGFIALPELSWRSFEDPSEIFQIGQSVSCVFLQFDTWNGEARLSLRETLPDPFRVFADTIQVGQELRAQVTKILPFGVIVKISDGVEAVIHRKELMGEPATPQKDGVTVGDDINVVVIGVDRERRTVSLSQRAASPGLE